MNNIKPIRWTSADPRDETATVGAFCLRVKAESRGTVWKATIKNGDITLYESEHRSKDSAKQKISKSLREILEKEESV